jgi:NAD(P)-dependent dehydrogenase (short-subunit alcohol dehydrogenase family)
MNTLIVGASGGIGAAICQAALADEKVARLLATSRNPDSLPRHDKLLPVALDLCDAQSIASAVETIRADVSQIDRLIVASGFLHDSERAPEKALRDLDGATMQTVLQINAVAPMLVFAALETLLKKSSEPKILFLSAQVGSIGDNRLGGWYSYRMAKAALNQGVKTAAVEAARWRNNATLIAVHPGTTLTALSEPFLARRQGQVQTPESCAALIWQLAGQVEAGSSGSFLRADGTNLPW